jgi:hypothetical protein
MIKTIVQRRWIGSRVVQGTVLREQLIAHTYQNPYLVLRIPTNATTCLPSAWECPLVIVSAKRYAVAIP